VLFPSTDSARSATGPSRVGDTGPVVSTVIVTAITLWNTVYMERALAALRADGSIEDDLVAHLSPLSWEHIHSTADYVWHANKRVTKGRLRSLRRSSTRHSRACVPRLPL
jgi:Tn3 transposase DDE domain